MKNKLSTLLKFTDSRIMNIVFLCLFVLCAGIYNYGLHRSFWPDYEYSIPIYQMFLDELYGLDIHFYNLGSPIMYFVYKLFGCSLKALRVYSATIYQIIILFSTIAAIYSFEKKHFEWYKLGIFSFIAVLLHPGSSLYCGQHGTLAHCYPYDLHVFSVIFSTLSVMLLCIHQGITTQKYKNILKVIITAVMVIGYKHSDFLYILGFVGPLICVGVIYLWREKRKLFFALIFGVIAALALLHVISFAVPSLASLFVHSHLTYGTWVYGTTIYGNTGFGDLGEIHLYVSNTIAEFLAMFNIDISGRSMLSIGTLLAGIRLILVIVMFICSFKIIISAVKKKDDSHPLDPISLTLAMGILFNFFLMMVSDYGEEKNCIRYMTTDLFYGAILLARQSENIILRVHGVVDNQSKRYFFLFFSMAIIANMTTFWKVDDYVADYEPAMQNVSTFIVDNHLGNGIGGHGFSSTLTLLGEGNYAVVKGDIYNNHLYTSYIGSAPATFNYIIDWPNELSGFSEEEAYKYLGEPDEVYEIDGFIIYYYPEGFSR